MVLFSCGLFKPEEKPVVIQEVETQVFAYVDSTVDGQTGKKTSGAVQGLVVRGDTLFVLGNGMLYISPPGEALKRVDSLTWEGEKDGVTSYRYPACPTWSPGFIGAPESLWVTGNYSGFIWQIPSRFSLPAISWRAHPNDNELESIVWAGWFGGKPYQLYGARLESADSDQTVIDTQFNTIAQMGDTLYVGNGLDSLWYMEPSSLIKHPVSLDGIALSNWFLGPCGRKVCLFNEDAEKKRKDIYSWSKGGWKSVYVSPEADRALDDGTVLVDPYTYDDVTFTHGSGNRFLIFRQDSVFARYALGASNGWNAGSHGLAVRGDLLYIAGEPGAIRTFPISQALNWN
jgi:hypothetical protein